MAIVSGILLIGLAVWAARNSRFPVFLPIAALACSAACVFYPRALAYHPGVLEMTAIDVGQGDSLLLISPQGKTLLIDAGGPTGGASGIPAAILRSVKTSSHRCCGRATSAASTPSRSPTRTAITWVECLPILRNFRPRELWIGHQPSHSRLRAAPQCRGPPARHSHRTPWRPASTLPSAARRSKSLAPPAGWVPGSGASNDDSLVLHVAYEKDLGAARRRCASSPASGGCFPSEPSTPTC